MWVQFLHSTTCIYIGTIHCIKWLMSTTICSQGSILFPCFFYNLSFNSKMFSFTCLCSFFTFNMYVYVYTQTLYVNTSCRTYIIAPSCSLCDMCIQMYMYLNSTGYQPTTELCFVKKVHGVVQVSSVQGHKSPEGVQHQFCLVHGVCSTEKTPQGVYSYVHEIDF